jgi:hypothetical protein
MSVFPPVQSLGELMALVTSHSHVEKINVKSFTKFSLALDESIDTCDTAQLLIFVPGIDAEF